MTRICYRWQNNCPNYSASLKLSLKMERFHSSLALDDVCSPSCNLAVFRNPKRVLIFVRVAVKTLVLCRSSGCCSRISAVLTTNEWL